MASRRKVGEDGRDQPSRRLKRRIAEDEEEDEDTNDGHKENGNGNAHRSSSAKDKRRKIVEEEPEDEQSDGNVDAADEEEDEEEVNGTQGNGFSMSQLSQYPASTQNGNKYAPPALLDLSLSRPSSRAVVTDALNRGGSNAEGYKRGSIVRIRMINFVTYTDCEVRATCCGVMAKKALFCLLVLTIIVTIIVVRHLAGPSRSSAKRGHGTQRQREIDHRVRSRPRTRRSTHCMSLLSAVVCVSVTHCAHSSTQILGRAKEVREFIKHGKDKATIEIELCNTKGRNVVVQRTILQDNKSQWKLNGHGVGKARVMDVMKKLNVQVDNLCQFLPQDRYVHHHGHAFSWEAKH